MARWFNRLRKNKAPAAMVEGDELPPVSGRMQSIIDNLRDGTQGQMLRFGEIMETARTVGLSQAERQNLRGADLSAVQFEPDDFEALVHGPYDMRGASLKDALFSGFDSLPKGMIFDFTTRLDGARIELISGGFAHLTNAAGADLTGMNQVNLHLSGDCRGVQLQESVYKHLTISHGTDMRRSDFTSAKVLRMDVEGATEQLSRRQFSAYFGQSTFDNATLIGHMTHCDVSRASFRGANLQKFSAQGSDLRHADLSGVNASDCDFSNTNLMGAVL